MSTPQPDQLRKLAIVPAYNEQGMVARVVREIRRNAPDFDIVVVDDGSTDRTAPAAEATGATVVRHPFNLGIGGAMQTGFKYALANRYDIAAQVDGDGQHKTEYLSDLLAVLRTNGEADMVCGSRFLEDPGYKVPVGRRIGNLIFSIVLTTIVRRRITDPTSGFRITNRRGIELFARDYPHDYPEVEAILMLHAHRLRLHEVPVRMNARGFGRSSIDYPRSAYYMAKVLLAIFVGLFRRRPVPLDDPPDLPAGQGVAPGAGLAGAGSDPAPQSRGS
jgi:glycosyltransferase involved in cell wall biosynthesis